MSQEVKPCPCHSEGLDCAVSIKKGGCDASQNCTKYPCMVHADVTPLPAKTKEE